MTSKTSLNNDEMKDKMKGGGIQKGKGKNFQLSVITVL